MKFLSLLLVDIKNKPQEIFSGVGVISVAVMGTSVHHVASTVFGILLIASFFIIKDWKIIWGCLTKNEKWLLLAFALYAFSGVLAFMNVQDVEEYIKELERYLRFLAAVPIYLFLKKYQVDILKYLYIGSVVSGPFVFFIAFSDYMENPDLPASGHYHHIIFGSVAMLNAGVMLALLLFAKINNVLRVVIMLSMMSAFAAAVLSQSRGVWLVLPFYLFIALYYSFRQARINFLIITVSMILLSVFILNSSIGDMIEKRIDAAVTEVSDFYTKDNYMSSLGTRLAMWEIAVEVWKQHPVIGSGPGDFDEIIRDLQKNGKFVGMDVHGSTHNIYFQSLVNAGLFGLLTMVLAVFVMPLRIILQSRTDYPVASLVGFVFILLFATIGLSESWTLRLPTVSVFLIYLVVIVSYVNIGKAKKLTEVVNKVD